MGTVVRGIDDMRVVAVDVIAEPDVLRDEIGGGVSTGGVGAGLGGGGGGDGERVDRTGGGSISETGISEISPALPSIKGDRAKGGVDGSSRMLFRSGETLRSGAAESIALVDAEDG